MTLKKPNVVAEPQLKDLLDVFKKDILLNLNCHALATIKSFDSSNQTVTCTINYKKTYFEFNTKTNNYDKKLVSYPLMVSVPIIILGGGTSNLTFPISAGDECIILFNDRDADNWFNGQKNGEVASPRLHSFSDGFALIGIKSLSNSISGYDTSRASLFNGNTAVQVSSSKVRIKNASKNLKTLLQSLISEIQAITVTGVSTGGGTSGPPSNAAALAAISTEIGELLE